MRPVVTHHRPLTHPQACLALGEWVLAAVISRTPHPAHRIETESEGFVSAAGAGKAT
jgi:hypothetical protein